MKKRTIEKTLNFGNFGEIKIEYEINQGVDTRVSINGSELMWTSCESIEDFEKDFLELINKYFI